MFGNSVLNVYSYYKIILYKGFFFQEPGHIIENRLKQRVGLRHVKRVPECFLFVFCNDLWKFWGDLNYQESSLKHQPLEQGKCVEMQKSSSGWIESQNSCECCTYGVVKMTSETLFQIFSVCLLCGCVNQHKVTKSAWACAY